MTTTWQHSGLMSALLAVAQVMIVGWVVASLAFAALFLAVFVRRTVVRQPAAAQPANAPAQPDAQEAHHCQMVMNDDLDDVCQRPHDFTCEQCGAKACKWHTWSVDGRWMCAACYGVDGIQAPTGPLPPETPIETPNGGVYTLSEYQALRARFSAQQWGKIEGMAAQYAALHATQTETGG